MDSLNQPENYALEAQFKTIADLGNSPFPPVPLRFVPSIHIA